MSTSDIKSAAAGVSVVSNMSLVVVKGVVGFVTGSISILAEAIHSAADLLAAVMAYFAVRVADQPPDEAHAYGHGKYENISGTAEALLIIAAAAYIGYEAVKKIYHPEPMNPGLGVIVMFISAVVNWLVSARLFKVAKETDSVALEADGHHLRLDVYTSAGIFVGLSVVLFTRGVWHGAILIDPILGLGVAVWIGWIGLQLSYKALGPLLDLQLPPGELDRILAILRAEEQVLGFHKLRTRKSGAHRHVDVHLIVPNGMSLSEAHDLAEEVEDKIRAEFDSVFVLTHVEPEGD